MHIEERTTKTCTTYTPYIHTPLPDSTHSPPVRVLNVLIILDGPLPSEVRARTVTVYIVLGSRFVKLNCAELVLWVLVTPTSRFVTVTIEPVMTPFCSSTSGGSQEIVADGDTRSVVTETVTFRGGPLGTAGIASRAINHYTNTLRVWK